MSIMLFCSILGVGLYTMVFLDSHAYTDFLALSKHIHIVPCCFNSLWVGFCHRVRVTGCPEVLPEARFRSVRCSTSCAAAFGLRRPGCCVQLDVELHYVKVQTYISSF